MTLHWLHPAWIYWKISAEKIKIYPAQSHFRPYTLLEHADKLLEDAPGRESRADALVNLRRAIDQRVKYLIERFNLKRVPISEKPRGSIELLEFFGLIRPIMARNLIEARNAIEHHDQEPPEVKYLKEMAEFAWYFLRSTDLHIRPSSSLNFDSPYIEDQPRESSTAPPYRIVVDVDPTGDPPWDATIQGFVAAFALSEQLVEGHMVLDVATKQTRDERTQSKDRFWWEKDQQVAGDDDIFIQARLRGPNEYVKLLVQRFVLFS